MRRTIDLLVVDETLDLDAVVLFGAPTDLRRHLAGVRALGRLEGGDAGTAKTATMAAMEDAFWEYIGLTGWQVLALVVSTSVLFWFFTVLMRAFRSRLQLRVSILDLSLMMLVGAVAARSMLGDHPTLVAGVVCLVVMFGWEAVFRAWGRWRRQPPRPARAVVVDGRADLAAVRQVGITEADLWVRLRRAGVLQRADVRVAIVETDGTLTVIRSGQPVDPALVADVVGLPTSIREET